MKSKQDCDAKRRELEAQQATAKDELDELRKKFQSTQQSWQQKLQAKNQERERIRGRLTSFNEFVDNAKAAGQRIDEKKVKKRQEELDDQAAKAEADALDIQSEANDDLSEIVKEIESVNAQVQSITDHLAGLEDFEDILLGADDESEAVPVEQELAA